MDALGAASNNSGLALATGCVAGSTSPACTRCSLATTPRPRPSGRDGNTTSSSNRQSAGGLPPPQESASGTLADRHGTRRSWDGHRPPRVGVVIFADQQHADRPREPRLVQVRWVATGDDQAPCGVHPAFDVVVHVLASHDQRTPPPRPRSQSAAGPARPRGGRFVVAVRQRYCNPASTSAVRETPSSAAWTMRKMKTAAAAANAIRNREK